MIASLYLSSIPYIVTITTLVGLFYIVKRPIVALYIITFTFLFKNFYIFIGTSFEVWKLLSIGFFIIYFFKWIYKYKYNRKNIYETLYIMLFIYIILMTIINYFLLQTIDIHVMKGGFFKNEGRIFMQIAFFIISINLIFISAYTVKTHQHIYKILQLIVKACIVLAVFGIFQYIYVSFLGGENPFPIQASDGGFHSGYILNSMFRVNSIAGEPKHMGIAMALGITLLLLARINSLKLIKHDLFWIVIFFINLFLTFSTTGYILVFVGILIMLFLKGFINIKNIFFLAIFILIMLFIVGNMSEDISFIFEKQLSKASLEVQDKAVETYLLKAPLHALIGTGLGNIHHYAVEYLPINFPLFKDTPFKGNTGLFILLADYGLIGLIFFYIITFLLINNNLKLIKNQKSLFYPEEIVTTYFTLILSFIFLLRYYELLFLFIGIMLSLNKSLKERYFL